VKQAFTDEELSISTSASDLLAVFDDFDHIINYDDHDGEFSLQLKKRSTVFPCNSGPILSENDHD